MREKLKELLSQYETDQKKYLDKQFFITRLFFSEEYNFIQFRIFLANISSPQDDSELFDMELFLLVQLLTKALDHSAAADKEITPAAKLLANVSKVIGFDILETSSLLQKSFIYNLASIRMARTHYEKFYSNFNNFLTSESEKMSNFVKDLIDQKAVLAKQLATKIDEHKALTKEIQELQKKYTNIKINIKKSEQNFPETVGKLKTNKKNIKSIFKKSCELLTNMEIEVSDIQKSLARLSANIHLLQTCHDRLSDIDSSRLGLPPARTHYNGVKTLYENVVSALSEAKKNFNLPQVEYADFVTALTTAGLDNPSTDINETETKTTASSYQQINHATNHASPQALHTVPPPSQKPKKSILKIVAINSTSTSPINTNPDNPNKTKISFNETIIASDGQQQALKPPATNF